MSLLYIRHEDARKKKGIYIVAKPIAPLHISPLNYIYKYGRAYYTYLAYVDENGNEKIIRGGPEDNDMIKDVPNAPRLETQSNIPLEESYDKIEKGTEPETRFATRLDIPDDQLDEAWNTAVQVSKLIDDGQIKYLNNPHNR